MSRTRTINIAALNIAMHAPHSPDKYIDFIMGAFWLRDRVKLSNVHYAMIGSAYLKEEPNFEQEINGEFFRFVKIDPDEPWFNELTKEPATNLEKNEIRIPSHLLSNLQRIPFIFYPSSHRLYVVTKDKKDNMSPKTVKKILDNIFERISLEKNYPEVVVTVIPSEESVDKILKISKLERLSIELVRPNADDGFSDEVAIMSLLEKQCAAKLTQEMTSTRNGSLTPNDSTIKLAYVASRNGKVTGEGRDQYGVKIKESTEEIPLIKQAKVDSNIETVRNVLKRVADNWENKKNV